MSRGKRYDTEPKLNMKKVFAVFIAIAVVIMFIFMINGLLTKDDISGKITSESYFSVFKDDKWGVIDSKGDYVINPSYAEMILIPNNKVSVFICTYDTNYETGEYKISVLNEKNSQIFTEYDKVDAISYKDKNNNLSYDKNVLRVQKDGKYGLINFQGQEVLPINYDEIIAVSDIENSFKIKKDGKYGIVNKDGKIIVEPVYLYIDLLGNNDKSGFIVKNESGKYGIIDYSNNKVLDIVYDSIEKVYGNNLYVVTVNGKQKIVNKDNIDVLTTGFDSIKQILANNENAVIFIKDNKYGIMNLSGEVLIDAKYDDLLETKVGMFIAKENDKYGVIDISGEAKVEFKYSSIVYNEKADIYFAEDANFNTDILNTDFEIKLSGVLLELNESKGYLKLRIDNQYKYYNFKFEEKMESDIFTNRTLFLSKKDGKYGYVDKTGKVIVDYIYDDAIEQNDYGFVAVKKDGKWGSINSKGMIVQEPIYNLDDYLLIDFIGRWHLGLDINMNYYNQL